MKATVLDGFVFYRMKGTSLNMNDVHKAGEVIEVDKESYEYTSQSFKVEEVVEAPATASSKKKEK